MKIRTLGALGLSNLSDFRLLGLCLSVGFLIRLVPELLAFSSPIGFDTIYYGYIMKNGLIVSNWTGIFTTSWLLYALVVPLYSVFQGDPFIMLKAVAPLLFGLNVAGMYWFSRKMLNWSKKMSLFVGIFFALQLASLRISWDLLRNTLGLGILLFALVYTKDVGSKRGFALFSGLSLLAVFAHEYSAVILLTTVLGLLVWNFAKKQIHYTHRMLMLGLIPALSVFLVGVYLRINPIRFVSQSNVISAGDTVSGSSGLFFLTNYLQVQNSVDYYSSYWSLVISVGLLFATLFLPYIYLVRKGYFKNAILNIWTILLLIGALGCVVLPFFALQYWHRWMFMLVYPFTFYAVYGIAKIIKSSTFGKVKFSNLFSNKKVAFMVLLTVSLGTAYLFTPLTMLYANRSVPNVTGNFLYFSTDPAVPYQDEPSLVEAMTWFNSNSAENSCVILQHHFFEYGRLYLDNSLKIMHYQVDFDSALTKTFDLGFDAVYFVWWNTPIGWNKDPVPSGFVEVADFDRISIYSYVKA